MRKSLLLFAAICLPLLGGCAANTSLNKASSKAVKINLNEIKRITLSEARAFLTSKNRLVEGAKYDRENWKPCYYSQDFFFSFKRPNDLPLPARHYLTSFPQVISERTPISRFSYFTAKKVSLNDKSGAYLVELHTGPDTGCASFYRTFTPYFPLEVKAATEMLNEHISALIALGIAHKNAEGTSDGR